jgi:hypothetical protein
MTQTVLKAGFVLGVKRKANIGLPFEAQYETGF